MMVILLCISVLFCNIGVLCFYYILKKKIEYVHMAMSCNIDNATRSCKDEISKLNKDLSKLSLRVNNG